MWAITAAVKQGFVRVERAGEALVGHVGPVFVSIYVVLVGTGMWIFCMCRLSYALTFSRLHFSSSNEHT